MRFKYCSSQYLPKRQITQLLLIILFLFFPFSAQAKTLNDTPLTVSLPSQMPSGDTVNDQIWLTFYPAQGSLLRPAPAIVLLHPIGETENSLLDKFMERLAQRFAARGIGCALMSLPYHLQRHRANTDGVNHFIGQNIHGVVSAFGQSASDVSTVTTWLAARPDVDSKRLGVVGISLGALIAHLAMGKDPRLTAGVALEGGGDLPTLYRDSLEVKLHGHYSPALLTLATREELKQIDPAYADSAVRPRRVLMVAAARDQYVPPANALFLWNALGQPPIQWTDTNHFSFLLAGASVAGTAAAYLTRVWDGKPDDAETLPHIQIPTLKAGFLLELNGSLTPMLDYQLHSFASRADHISLLHVDAGLGLRGPFIALGASITPLLDAGLEHRVLSDKVQPYVTLQLAF